MDYEQLVKGARKYPLEDNIYDLASLMVSRHGIESDESIAGIFTLIFSWNRFYYTPPSPSRLKPIEILDKHIKQFKQTIETERKYILALKNKRLENIDFNEILQDVQVTVGKAISHLFSSFARFLGPTGASKALHLLLPQLIVLWDTQIRTDYGIKADADFFLKFQGIAKALLEGVMNDFVKKHGIDRESALQEILRLTYGDKPKSLPKLIDEFNWATRGESKRHILSH